MKAVSDNHFRLCHVFRSHGAQCDSVFSNKFCQKKKTTKRKVGIWMSFTMWKSEVVLGSFIHIGWSCLVQQPSRTFTFFSLWTCFEISWPNSFLPSKKSFRVIEFLWTDISVKITGHWIPIFLSFALKKSTAKQEYRPAPKDVKSIRKRVLTKSTNWAGELSNVLAGYPIPVT